jgi:hypothetical protein
MKKFVAALRPSLGRFLMLLAAVALLAFANSASAQTDLTGTLTSLNGYWTTAEGIGIGVILFVVGRKLVRKI